LTRLVKIFTGTGKNIYPLKEITPLRGVNTPLKGKNKKVKKGRLARLGLTPLPPPLQRKEKLEKA